MKDRYHAIDSPTAGTCEWLFHHTDFQIWRDPKPDEALSDRLLWLKANAGAGKSTLIKVMYEYSRQQESSYTLCYFFNARSPVQALDNSFCGMLRSLLWRLLTYDLSLLSVTPELCELKKQNRTAAEAWHLNEAKDLFSRCLRKVQGHRVYLYIDALDECPEDQARAAIKFFEVLAEQIDFVRLLFSSRFCPFISHRGREIEMEPNNAPDIWKYIDTHLPSTVDGQSSQMLRNLIGERSSGIFLWTVIAVNEVIKANDRSLAHRQIQDLVEEIPPDLKLMIEDILRKIDPVHSSKACLIFNWVLLASDALDPLEVYALTRFDPKNSAENDASQWQSDFVTIERAIRTFSGGLLEIKSTQGRRDQLGQQYVQFIHESVRDHLQTSSSLKRLLTGSSMLELIPNHTSLAEFCLEYIGQVAGFGDMRLDENEMAKLLDLHAEIFRHVCAYAPLFGFMSDFRDASLVDNPRLGIERLFDVAEDHKAHLIDHSNAEPNSEQCTRWSEYFSSKTWDSDLNTLIKDLDEAKYKYHQTLEFRSKYENLRKSVKFLAPLQNHDYYRSKDGRGRPHFLKDWRHDEMRSMYRRLKTPFPLLPRSINEVFLHLRLAQDDTVMERLTTFLVVENSFLKVNLLDSMICVSNFCSIRDRLHWRTSYRDQKYNCALSERYCPDWQNQAVLRLAAGCGLFKLLEKLLALSARNLNVEDIHGSNPLDHSLKSGCASTSALLLQKGAIVNMKGPRGSTAKAIMENGTGFVETLISYLVESKDQESTLGRLLVSSVYASQPDLIDFLSKGGADMNAKFDDGRDALILASRLANKDSEKVINALLRHGATPHCRDRLERTALHYLSGRSDCKTVEVLLKSKPNVNALDRTGQTPLDFALTCGNSEVAELLRVHGAISVPRAEAVRAPDDQRSTTTIESSDEWEIDRDQGSAPWESDSED